MTRHYVALRVWTWRLRLVAWRLQRRWRDYRYQRRHRQILAQVRTIEQIAARTRATIDATLAANRDARARFDAREAQRRQGSA